MHVVSGFDAVKSVFDGGCFAKFKNGMAWSHGRAASRYHLRVVLATGLFSLPNYHTIGALRSDSSVQKVESSAWSVGAFSVFIVRELGR